MRVARHFEWRVECQTRIQAPEGRLQWATPTRRTCITASSARKSAAHCISDEFQPKLWDYIGGIARNNSMTSLRVGGISNHLHILLGLPASMPIAKAMQLIKGGSSKWINEHPLRFRFAWQDGYGAFSIGSVAGAGDGSVH